MIQTEAAVLLYCITQSSALQGRYSLKHINRFSLSALILQYIDMGSGKDLFPYSAHFSDV